MKQELVYIGKREKDFIPCEVYFFGIDTIRFNFNEDFEGSFFNSLFNGLSLNSPQNDNLVFLGIEVSAIFSMVNGKRILTLSSNGDAIICIEHQLAKVIDSVSVNYSVVFYSAFFNIDGLMDMFNLFVRKYADYMWVGRVDLCMDVSATVNQLHENHVTRSIKNTVFRTGQRVDTFYLGSKSHNQRHFIRVYDKKLDSAKKGKFHLFAHYFNLPVVTRIELQVNSLSCRKYDIEPYVILDCYNTSWQKRGDTYLNASIFRGICFNYLQTCFLIKPIPVSVQRMKVSEDYNNNETLNQLPYARRMLGYAKRLDELGFDVISYLTSKLQDIES